MTRALAQWRGGSPEGPSGRPGGRLFLAGLLLASLSSPPAVAAPRPETGSRETGARESWAEDVRRRGLDPEAIVLPDALDSEMRRWLRERVPRESPPEERLRLLIEALLDPDDLGLRYDAATTGTAQEVFAGRRANCLGFTHLFVGMARELELAVYYLAVEDRQAFDKEGDLIIVSGHVTAAYGDGSQRLIIDFQLGGDPDYRSARRLSDAAVRGLFYSNRGAELLRSGEIEAAVEQLQVAVRLAPELAAGWVNLGVARRRSGDLEGAERAYRRVIEASPESLSAIHNLSALFHLQGREDASREVLRLLDRRDNRNPFAYLALGDASLRRGRLEEAGRFYRRARRLDPSHAEVRAAMGLWALARGEPERARAWLRRARRAAAGSSRVEALAQKLAAREDRI